MTYSDGKSISESVACAGILCRTKLDGTDEGGVAAGFSVLNSVFLKDWRRQLFTLLVVVLIKRRKKSRGRYCMLLLFFFCTDSPKIKKWPHGGHAWPLSPELINARQNAQHLKTARALIVYLLSLLLLSKLLFRGSNNRAAKNQVLKKVSGRKFQFAKQLPLRKRRVRGGSVIWVCA